MRAISDRFKAALGVSHRRTTQIDCTVPGGDPVRLRWDSASVSSSNSTGVRYSASLALTPVPGQDTYGMVSTPGALFTIKHGINFGAGSVELIDCGVYEAASGGVQIAGGDVSLQLVDLWQRLDRCRFLAPFSPPSGTRASLISTAVTNAIPFATLSALSTGGNFVSGTNLWDRDRTQFITDMSKDGSLDAAFDASGAFRIRNLPILDSASSVWTFRTGASSNINTAERQRPFDKLYNTVIVQPLDSTQSWDDQAVSIADPTHPRHPDKIGVVPFFYKSATANNNAEALQVAGSILQRVLGTTETISIDGLSNPALEVGDVVTIAHDATDTDPGFQAFHIIDSWQMDLASGAMSLATRSSSLVDLEEN